MKQIKKRLTYANVMSSIAVFLVLGGGAAFAANQLGKNSVGSKQLKKGAVTGVKIKKDAITGDKVKPGSLSAADFAAGQLPVGPKGEKGDKGDKGAPGAPGLSFGAFANGSCGDLEGGEEEIFESCASIESVDLPSSGNVLLIASAEWDNDDSEDLPPNSGRCRLSVDGDPVSSNVSFGELTETHGIGEGGSISMNWITAPLSAGSHSFAFECTEQEGSVYIDEAMLSAVLLDSASVQMQLPN